MGRDEGITGNVQGHSKSSSKDSSPQRSDQRSGSFSMSLHLFRGIVREWVLVTLILLPLTAFLSIGHLISLDSLIYDRLLPYLPVPVDPRILVVEIDDRSVAELGRWPWPRDIHTQLLEQLSGEYQPAAVLFDVIFTEPDADPAVDERLGAAVCKAGNIMLPVLSDIRQGERTAEILPIEPLARCAQQIGHINVRVDFDGVIRGIHLREGPPGELRPQLAWLMYQQLMIAEGRPALMPGQPGQPGRPGPSSIAISKQEHWQRDHAIRTPFAAGYPSVSYLNVVRGEVPASLLQDRVVLIGATAAGLGDRYATPVSRYAGLTPGIVVQADILNSLLGGHSIEPFSRAAAASLTTVPVVLLLLSLLLTRLRYAIPMMLLVAAFTLVLCWVLLRFGWWWPPAASLLGLLLATLLWSWRRLSAVLAYFGWELARLDAEPKVLPEYGAPAPNGPGDRLQQRVMALERAVGRVRDSRRFMSDGLEHLPVATLVCTPDEQILVANRRTRELLDRELVGSDLRSCLFDLGYRDWSGKDSIEALDAVEFRTSEGRSLRLGVASILPGGGVIAPCLLVSLVDLTAEREMEAQRTNMLRFLSHDLRAPHSAILSLLDTAKRENGDHEALEQIRYQTNRALRLIDDFTHLSRADTAAFQLRPTLFAAVALDACDQVWAQAQAKGIHIDKVLIADDAMVMADQALLCRALFNLLENAIKYSPPESRVELRLEQQDGWVSCAVSDEGDGIATEDMPHLFDLYRRLSSARTSDGLGLGLPMVGMVADCHAGRVECQSKLGQGSCFTLHLPAMPDDVG